MMVLKMIETIINYEEVSMNAHPALKTELYDGWVLRFSNGYTNRANSINPLYKPFLPLEEKVAVCERKYSKQGLPTVFKLTDISPEGLDEYLDERGYKILMPTYLFVNDVLPVGYTNKTVNISEGIDSSWREDFFRLSGLADDKKILTASAMMDKIQSKVLSARIFAGEKTVACGLCVTERGYVGLYDIVVDVEYRRRGYGFELCKALLSKSGEPNTADISAKSAYLQVVASNEPAVSLYKKLGYKYCYKYWYRIKHET